MSALRVNNGGVMMQKVAVAFLAVFGTSIFSGAACSSPLDATIDLLAPATPCTASGCPSDINLPILGALPLGGSSFTYALSAGTPPVNYLATLGLDNTNSATYPIVCDEISGSGIGPVGTRGFTATYSNATANGGGALGFGAGGTNRVDMSSLSYSNASGQPGVSLISGNTLTQQVTCYPVLNIGAVAGGAAAPVLASSGTAAGDRVFYAAFENPLSVGTGEPWITATTALSPTASGGNSLLYVLQIHNANKWTGWHVDFGYDTAYFGTSAQWCVISNTYPQPGTIPQLNCGLNKVTTNGFSSYTVSSGDIQAATNSVYLQVILYGTAAAKSNFTSVPNTFYPALGAVFPPAGTYPQRLDSKVAVASANNLPVQSVGNVVCANTIPTSCTVYDADGNLIGNISSSSGNLTQGQLNIAYTVTSDTVSLNPVAYYVSPTGGTMLPGNPALVGSLTCAPSPILSPSTPPTLGPTGANLGFTFAQQAGGGVYVPGTATCSATFTTGTSAPFSLANTFAFTISMMPTTATHFSVTAPASTTAGVAMTNAVTVTALDAGNHPVTTYSGTVIFHSSDLQATLPASSTLTNGTGTFSATLFRFGSQTITATDSVTPSITGSTGAISVMPAAAASLSVVGPSTVTQGSPATYTVYAYDAYNNISTGCTDTVQISSSDTAATLPASAALVNGSGSFTITFNTVSSTQTITATDTTTPSVTPGQMTGITVN